MEKTSKNGSWIYFVKKDGSLYKHPTFISFCGFEKTAEDVIKRLKKLNPDHEFVAA